MYVGQIKNKGLTMLELMITLAVATILIASAAPSFRESIQNTRLVTQVNELQTALSLARSEAVKRNENVTVCASSDGSSCDDDWRGGWIVFVNVIGDGVGEEAASLVDDADSVLRVRGNLSSGNTLTFSDSVVSFDGKGLAQSGVNGVFTLCDSRGSDRAKGLVIGLSGRPRLAIESDNLDC